MSPVHFVGTLPELRDRDGPRVRFVSPVTALGHAAAPALVPWEVA